MNRIAIILALLLIAGPVAAKTRVVRAYGGPPKLDIQSTCKRATPLWGEIRMRFRAA